MGLVGRQEELHFDRLLGRILGPLDLKRHAEGRLPRDDRLGHEDQARRPGGQHGRRRRQGKQDHRWGKPHEGNRSLGIRIVGKATVPPNRHISSIGIGDRVA